MGRGRGVATFSIAVDFANPKCMALLPKLLMIGFSLQPQCGHNFWSIKCFKFSSVVAPSLSPPHTHTAAGAGTHLFKLMSWQSRLSALAVAFRLARVATPPGTPLQTGWQVQLSQVAASYFCFVCRCRFLFQLLIPCTCSTCIKTEYLGVYNCSVSITDR